MAQGKDASAAPANFTEREIKYMAAACQSFKGDPQLDIEKFASLAGLTVGSARNAWAAIKKKLKTSSDSTSQPNGGEDSINATPVPKRNAAANKTTAKKRGAAALGDGELDGRSSPVKKPRGRRKSKAVVVVAQKTVEEEDDDDEDDDEEVLGRLSLSRRGKSNSDGKAKVKSEPCDDDDDHADAAADDGEEALDEV